MDHLIDDEELPRRERELTLSTGSILGIFLGLAVLCGAFFGFGYNMGRKSAPTPLSLADVTPDVSAPTPNLSNSTTLKPPAGSPLETTPSSTTATVSKPVRHAAPPVAPSSEEAESSPEVTAKAAVGTKAAPATPAPIVRPPVPVPASALSGTTAVAAPAAGSYMVQVAAVSHQEDATLLVGALRARGYAVSTRSNSADSFIHVQVGPFHDKKEADAMRQRLLTDGYNAIVKQ